jgi:hypothetical protein
MFYMLSTKVSIESCTFNNSVYKLKKANIFSRRLKTKYWITMGFCFINICSFLYLFMLIICFYVVMIFKSILNMILFKEKFHFFCLSNQSWKQLLLSSEIHVMSFILTKCCQWNIIKCTDLLFLYTYVWYSILIFIRTEYIL